MTLFDDDAAGRLQRAEAAIAEALDGLDLPEQMEAINALQRCLHRHNPIPDPVGCVQFVPAEQVEANGYNPNHVAAPEMRLLYLSIKEDGYTQPIVACTRPSGGYEVVDGFHRHLIPERHRDIRERLHGYLPVTLISAPVEERMASTIRHNRARGKHGVAPMGDLVASLVRAGKPDDWIARHLGMEFDEVLRLKQVTGLAELFRDRDYSRSWTVGEEETP